MLDTLRKAARTWVAKILMLLLVASFGIWGVSQSLVSSGSDTVVAVGNQSVSANEFRLAYQRQLSELGQRFGTQLTSEQARALGIQNQVFSQLAAGAALDQLSDDMNLGLSKDRLAGLIAEDPAFRGPGGQFDRQLFSSRLRNAGLREDDYILERSKVAVRNQIVEATADGFAAPKILVDALKQFQNESRAVDYLLLTTANIDPVAAPAEDVLSAWFETVMARYRAPEYRSFSYARLEPSDIADPSSISDEAIKADYEKQKSTFEIAGTRTIEQMTFENRDMADAAAEELAAGTSFDQLVSDQGKTATDVLLGDFTKATVPDAKLADAAFAVEKDGGTTPVIDGTFGPVILRVTNITQGRTRSFDEVKDEIRSALANEAAVADVMTVHDQFEDLRASGSSLAEAAAKLNLKAVTVDKVDRGGIDAKDVAVKDIPASDAVLAEVFKTDIGVEALPVSVGSDGYVWFDVTDIVAERDRTLDEARAKAVADWTREQEKTMLGAKTESLKQQAAAGQSLADIAATLKIAVESKSGLLRSTDDPVLGRAGVDAAFAGPIGTLGAAPGADPATQILLKVTEVNVNPTTNVLSTQDAQVATIANAAGDDILDQMVNRLQTEYGVTINQALADQAMVR
ncbi:MAG: SurA N-terminal domain-containing protein [Allorhizobium sp.]